MPVPLIGPRIRNRRIERGLSQAALASAVGISPSYLNLIEHNRRAIAGALLHRIAQALGLELSVLTGAEEARLMSALGELAADRVPALELLDARERERLLTYAPDAARAMVALYRAYRAARSQLDLLTDRLNRDPFLAEASYQILTLVTTIRSFSEILHEYGDLTDGERRRFAETLATESEQLAELSKRIFDFIGGSLARSPSPSPEEEIDDFFEDHLNYFPALEDAALELRRRILREDELLPSALIRFLRSEGGADASTLPEGLPEPSVRFHLARKAAELACTEVVERLVEDERLQSEEARRQCRRALFGYAAGALLFPYEPFLAAARETRYDIEALQRRFGASFEQVCHRLTTLRRPGSAGIPFHFLRSDIAGNLSKRFSLSGLRLPRYGGVCPRWALYGAFTTPGRVVSQLAELPDGERFLFVARADARPPGSFGTPVSCHAVMIGCRLAHAEATVYLNGVDLRGAEFVPVGISCRQCPREPCAQRAHPRALGSA